MTSMSVESKIALPVTRSFSASPERVFNAWLDAGKVGTWMFSSDEIVRMEIDGRVGGKFSFVVRRDGEEIDHTGEYLEIDRPRRLVFTWGVPQASPDFDRVIVEIAPLETGCELTLIHELHPEWADYASRTAAAWTKMLNELAAVVD
jgi:uncharacterized protein YndB with AHSA1/START domain